MKYIKKIEKTVIKNLNDEPLKDKEGNLLYLELKDFILQRLYDVKFSSDMEGVLSAVQIKQALKDSDNQEFIALETKDWEKLSNIVKSPSNPYNPEVAPSLIDCMKAVVGATDEKPGFVKTDETAK